MRLYLKAIVILYVIITVIAVSPLFSTIFHSFLPSSVSTSLFLFPQYVFLYPNFYLVKHVPYTTAATIGGKYAYLLSLMQWILILGGAAWFLRRLKGWKILLLGVGIIVILTIVFHVALTALGYKFQLDGL